MKREDLMKLINLKGRAYLAGGWFSDEQMERLEYVRDTLKDLGFSLFSPKDENLVTKDSSDDFATQAYNGNINAIKNASFVFCITNCKDMGTIHESGVASTLNIPIIYFAEGLEGPFNLMLAKSGIHVITSREQLIKDMTREEVLIGIITNNNISNYRGEIE